MKKINSNKILLSVLIIFMLVFSNYSFADNSNTITFLQNQTQNSWITQALASVNVNNINTSYINLSDTNLLASSKNLLALSSIESSDKNTLNTLADNINSSFNNGQLGDNTWLNDDFWAVIALSSVNKIENTDSIKSFILNNQNTDGGWSWAVSGNSDTNDTASAIMALLELGLNKESTQVTNALNYLHSAQKDDGGFGYDTSSNSDSNSTAWVVSTLNKVNINSNTWTKNGNTALTFLESLRQNDGSYLWINGSTSGITLSTAYTLLAISGASYPVKHINIDDNGNDGDTNNEVLVDLRIESENKTVCLAKDIQADNVLELLQVGASICGYQFIVEDTSYGAYVSSIDNLSSSGMNGWQYFVNWTPAMVSAQNYILSNGDEVLWAYGSALGIKPTQVEVNSTDLSTGDNLEISVSYFENGEKHALANEEVLVGQDVYTTDNNGKINMDIEEDNNFSIYTKYTDTYIRSNRIYINTLGQGTVNHSVNLSANITDSDVIEDEIAFSVDKSNINFGNLSSGDSKQETLTLTNTGDVNIFVESNIVGDELFSNMTLNDSSWQDFMLSIGRSHANEINIELTIPSNYNNLGQKNAELIFWATSQ